MGKKCCIGCNIALGIVGLLLIAVGVVIVNFVDDRINDGVKSALKIEAKPDGTCCKFSDDSDLQDFLVTDLNYSYYAFNITNLPAILGTGAKPVLSMVGPWSVNEKNHKYNMSFGTTPDGQSIFLYNNWWRKEWKTAADLKATTDLITSINPAYVSAIGLIRNASWGATQRETTLLLNLMGSVYSGPTGTGGMRDNFLSATGSGIVPQATVGSMGVYLNGGWLTYNASYPGGPHSRATMVELWRRNVPNNAGAPALYPLGGAPALAFKGFELNWDSKLHTTIIRAEQAFGTANNSASNAPTLPQDIAMKLWDPVGPISWVSSAGLSVWVASLGCDAGGGALSPLACTATTSPTATEANGALALIKSHLSSVAAIQDGRYGYLQAYFISHISQIDAALSVPPLNAVLAEDYFEYFTAVAFSALAPYCPGIALPPITTGSSTVPVYSAASPSTFAGSWAQVGACQFGLGGFTKLTTGGATVGVPCTSGLILNSCTGPEIYAAITKAGNVNLDFNLSLSESLTMLETLNSATGRNGIVGIVSPNELLKALPDSAVWGLQAAAISVPVAAYKAGVPLQRNADLILNFNTSGFTSARAAFFDDMVNYIITYAPGNLALVDQIFHKNGGLFTVRNPASLMFGYEASNPDPLLAQAGQRYPGIISNWTSEAQQWETTHMGRYAEYTGETKIENVRHYYQWRGATAVQKASDLPENVFQNNQCFCEFPLPTQILADPTLATKCVRQVCDDIWTSAATITGTSTGSFFAPFQEGKDPPTYSIWGSSTAYRALAFKYSKDVTLNGVKLRRFIISPDVLKNSSQVAANAQFRQYDPEGCVAMKWWFREVPVILAKPFFFGGDPILYNQFTWENELSSANDALETYVDVEPLSGATFRGHKRLQYTVKVTKWAFDFPYWDKLFTNALVDQGWTHDNWPNSANNWLGLTLTGGTDRQRINFGGKVWYWPAFWADETGQATEKDTSDFKSAIYDSRDLAEWLQIAALAGGALLLIVAILCGSYWVKKDPGMTSLKSDIPMDTV